MTVMWNGSESLRLSPQFRIQNVSLMVSSVSTRIATASQWLSIAHSDSIRMPQHSIIYDFLINYVFSHGMRCLRRTCMYSIPNIWMCDASRALSLLQEPSATHTTTTAPAPCLSLQNANLFIARWSNNAILIDKLRDSCHDDDDAMDRYGDRSPGNSPFAFPTTMSLMSQQ
jgi:hypothetical protein